VFVLAWCLTWALGLGLRVEAATAIRFGEVKAIRGPADLDLEGEILYAINFSADDPPRQVKGVTFVPDTHSIAGATLVAPQQVLGWQAKPEFGEGADDNQLEEILADIRWAVAGAGERLRATLAVQAGEQYRLQILISGNSPEDRRWDIRVGGREAVDEISSLGVTPGQAYSADRATLYTCVITATAATLVVEMGDLFGVNDGGDRNPIWQALTLEHIRVPPAPEDIVLEPAEFTPSQAGPIGALRVVDAKEGALHAITLASGLGDADNAKFAISGTNLFPWLFDFASQPPGTRFSIRLRATDTADARRVLEKVVEIKLAEPHPPTSVRLDAGSVSSVALSGDLVARILVQDPDPTDVHALALVDGAGAEDNAWFVVSGSELRLAKSLEQGRTLVRVRLRATDRTGLALEQAIVVPVERPGLRITEILANEVGGVPDERGVLREWIEIRNPLPQYVVLREWSLTDDKDDLRRWKFPAYVAGPGETFVVLADGLGTAPAGSKLLHSSFSLSSDGEWLGLVGPDGATLVSELNYPRQYPGVSYGIGVEGRTGYLPQPTPRLPNGSTASAGENPVSFSRSHGFYTNSFELELSAGLPGSVIRYTLDGTAPTLSGGLVYAGPIRVTPNTAGTTRGVRVVRAIAVNPEAAFAPVGTQTYLFVNGVAGPSTDGIVSQSRLATSITRHATYGPLMDDALLALPSLSVVMVSGPGGVERTASVELMDPGQREPGFQIDCGVAVTGTTSLGSPKLSMAARFRTKYGPAKLRYPVFARGSRNPARSAESFNELRLRSHSHDTFYWLGTRENPPVPYGNPAVTRSGDAQYARNPWIEETQLSMGQPGKHGRQVHLYLNGSYHGLYHIQEHADEDFMASYYPGSREDFHFTGAAKSGSDHGGGDTWRTPWGSVKASLNNYTQAKRWIDVTNLCDYMVLSFYAGNDWDWSAQHNWAAAGPRQPDRGGWKFFAQDSDICLQDVAADCTDQDVPDGIFTALMRQADFRVLFRDRVYRHCFGDGVLTPERAGARYDDWMNEIRVAIVAETARWQPSSSVAALPWDRDQEWMNEWRYLRETFFPQRTARFLQQIRRRSGWWTVEPPSLVTPAGNVPLGQVLSFTAAAGTVRYTVDGSDPRLPGGALAVGTRTGSLTLERPTLIRARAYTGSDWSALVEAYYVPEGTAKASVANLVLSEIQYAPLDEPDAEFLEFLNTSRTVVDLSDAGLSNAVSYRFPKGTLIPAGGRVVVAKNPALFAARYGQATSPYFREGVSALGPWLGSLSSEGEAVDVLGASGELLFRCLYGSADEWPQRANRFGSSLELVDPASVPSTTAGMSAWLSDPRRWRPSLDVHGSPGGPGRTPVPGVVLNEIVNAPPPAGSDAIELMNTGTGSVDVSGWFLSDSLSRLRMYRFPSRVVAAGARLVLTEADFRNPANPASLVPFGLDASGDEVHLVAANPDGALLWFADSVEFGNLGRGRSFGRVPDGMGPWVVLETPSLGAPNATGVSGFAAWVASLFSGNRPPADRLPEADPDGDGQSNWAEYAFGSSPLEPSSAPVEVRRAEEPGALVVTYRIRTSATELRSVVETSRDLRGWEDALGRVVEVSRETRVDDSTRVTIRLSLGSAPLFEAGFVRIKAVLK
jgi:hypothetical protein